MLCSPTVLEHKCTSYQILFAFAPPAKAFHPVSPGTQETMERWVEASMAVKEPAYIKTFSWISVA